MIVSFLKKKNKSFLVQVGREMRNLNILNNLHVVLFLIEIVVWVGEEVAMEAIVLILLL